MASLSVRKLDEEVYQELRKRAAEHGISMEEEVRRILEQAVAAPERLGELALECFGPEHGVELELPPRRPHEPLDLDRDPDRDPDSSRDRDPDLDLDPDPDRDS